MMRKSDEASRGESVTRRARVDVLKMFGYGDSTP